MPLREEIYELFRKVQTITGYTGTSVEDTVKVPDGKSEKELLSLIKEKVEIIENELVSYKNQLEESSIMLETQIEEISKTYEELSTLYDVTKILSKSLDPTQVLDTLIESIKNSIPSEGIGIYLDFLDFEDFILSIQEDSPINDNIEENKRYIIEYLKTDHPKTLIMEGEQLKEAFPQGEDFLNSLIIIPICGNNECYGALTLANRERGSIFTAGDRKLLESIANQIHFSLENYIYLRDKIEQERLHEQISIAKDIQLSLLPSEVYQPENVQIAASFSPAVEVAGDYYDVFPMQVGTFLIVADVSGKGIPASLLMSSFRSAVRIMAESYTDLPGLVGRVNDHIAQNEIADRFVTSMFIILDEDKGTFYYSNAGHDPIILYRKKKDEFFEISNRGIPIGIFEDQEYIEDSFKLERGDVFVVYTDGIPEARNTKKEEFGFERFKETVKKNADKTAQEIKDEILNAVSRFVGEAKQHDDTTFMVVKYQ